MIVIGVDPGGHDTGIIARAPGGDVPDVRTGVAARARDDVVAARCTVRRRPGEDLRAYLRRVLDSLHYDVVVGLRLQGDLLLAIEGVREPNPHVRLTNVRALLDTAAVFGAVAALTFAPVVVVDPAGHGAAPMTAYPLQLRPTRGDGRGHDGLRHERSAWDVAGAGLARWRTGGSVVWSSDQEPEPEGRGAR